MFQLSLELLVPEPEVKRKVLDSTPLDGSTKSFFGTLISRRRSTGVRQMGQRLV